LDIKKILNRKKNKTLETDLSKSLSELHFQKVENDLLTNKINNNNSYQNALQAADKK
jgi:hypothetical protein